MVMIVIITVTVMIAIIILSTEFEVKYLHLQLMQFVFHDWKDRHKYEIWQQETILSFIYVNMG
jgi:hypothetical protein